MEKMRCFESISSKVIEVFPVVPTWHDSNIDFIYRAYSPLIVCISFGFLRWVSLIVCFVSCFFSFVTRLFTGKVVILIFFILVFLGWGEVAGRCLASIFISVEVRIIICLSVFLMLWGVRSVGWSVSFPSKSIRLIYLMNVSRCVNLFNWRPF